MAPASFSVSEVRVAAACPRVSYFDAEHTRRHGLKNRAMTRLWKAGDAETACGALFHNAVEAFNRRALDAPVVCEALKNDPEPRVIERRLREYLNRNCVDLDALATKLPAQQQAFTRALAVYMGELADIVGDALARGKSTEEVLEQLFGDRRRRVDVTFQVGPNGEPVRVSGILDYVFYDWRTAHHRIIDYKLTPAGEPSNDLFQVALYGLMHNVQHRTQPDVAVLYLHPERRMVELTWEQVHGQRHKLFDLLASLDAWVRYDETTGTGLKPPGEPSCCAICKWDRLDQCARRLGPKHEGRRYQHWTEGTADNAEITDAAVGVSASEGSVRSRVNQTDAPPCDNQIADSAQPDVETLCIGRTVEGGEPIGLPLTVLPTHIAVVGAAGSGKTWMAKVLAEESVRLGVPVLAIDPQGDLVQFLRPAQESLASTDNDRSLRRAFLDRVEPRIWTPGSSHGRRLSLDPIRLAGKAELAGITDPDRRCDEWDGMLAVVASQLVSLTKIGGETESQETLFLQLLRLMASDERAHEVSLDALAAAVAAPETVGLTSPERFVKKSEREKLARKLNGLRVGPSAGLFTGGRPLDLDALCRPDASGKTPLNVIYLNALTGDDQKHYFVAALAAEVYRWMITSRNVASGRPHLLFYLDEARDYIPAGSSKPPAKAPLLRLFTQGRKYGVACLLCTQSPRSVDYNAFGNCSTKLVGRLESAQDLERVAELFATDGASPAWLPRRKGAVAGSFVGRWPQMPANLEGRAIQSRSLFSLHEGAWSPDRLEREMAVSDTGSAS